MEITRLAAYQMADKVQTPENKTPSHKPTENKDSMDSLNPKNDTPAAPGCMSKIGSAFSAVIGWVSNLLSFLLCCCCCKMDDKKVIEQIENNVLKAQGDKFQKEIDALPRQATKEIRETAEKYILLSQTTEAEDSVDANMIINAKAEDFAKIKAPVDMDKQVAEMLKGTTIYEVYVDVLKARLPKEVAQKAN